jgi:hypothetical protein
VVTAPDSPFTAAQIAQALLQLADAPPGSRLGTLSQSSALTSLCGKAPLLLAIPSANQAANALDPAVVVVKRCLSTTRRPSPPGTRAQATTESR